MANTSYSNAKVDYVDEVTLKGLAVLASFLVVFVGLYAISYPLCKFGGHPWLSTPFQNTFSLMYLALAAIGLGLAVKYRKSYQSHDFIIALVLAVLVWLAIQVMYWYNGWTPYIPYYAPTFNAIEVFLMTLGAIGLLRTEKVLKFRMADRDYRSAGISIGLGIVLGVPFALMNVIVITMASGQPIVIQDVIQESMVALRPGIMEEVAYRLLFMGLAMAILLKYLPRKVAICCAIFMAIVFHSAIHVPELLLTNPLMAAGTIILTSVLFGLPMALLAYKRDIETAIGFHWIVDAVRFSLGL